MKNTENRQSKAMGEERSFGVSLPPGYKDNLNGRYPVIFLLYGGHGSPTDWFEKGAALPTIQQLYAEGKLPPSIIITPDGNDWRGSSAFFARQYIDVANPNFWAIGGLSSGGWGALNVGLHHLQQNTVLAVAPNVA